MNNTTQELSKRERQILANRRCYEKNKKKRQKAARDNYQKNKERILKDFSDRRLKRTKEEQEYVRTYSKEYCFKNKKQMDAQARLYNKTHREQINAKQREYRKNNKDKFKFYYLTNGKKRHKERYKSDLNYRITFNLRGRLHSALKIKKIKQTAPSLELIGCTVGELRVYIEAQFMPGMSWENYRHNTWHIDHIKPVNTFNLTDPEQQKECFHYTNLRPLWAKDNLKRPKDGLDVITLKH
jgi:hypothetical protein